MHATRARLTTRAGVPARRNGRPFSALSVARLLLLQRVERFRSGLEPLDGYRCTAAIRQSVGAVIDLLQSTLDVAQALIVDCGQVTLQLERRQLLRVIFKFPRQSAFLGIGARLLAFLPAPDAQRNGVIERSE